MSSDLVFTREQIDSILDIAESNVRDLLAKIERLEDAVKWYADDYIWKTDVAKADSGKRARKALE